MKKLVAALLIGSLLILPTPVFAADERVNVHKLSFTKIEQHMNSYNTQIYSNNDKVASIEVPTSADKAKIQKGIDDIDAMILGYAAKKAALTPADAYLSDYYDLLIATATMNKSSLESQKSSFDTNVEKASEAKTNAAIQTEAGNKQIIWGAEQIYLGYNALTYQIKQQSSQLELLYRQTDVMKLQQELGMITKTAYESLEKSIKELAFAVKTMRQQQQSMKEQLNIMFNQNYDADLIIEETPVLDSSLIREMNFEEDYKEAQWLSYNVRLQDDSWLIEAEQRKFKQEFKKNYDNVFTKQETLELEESKLEKETEAFTHTQLRYDLGMISKLKLEEQKLTLQNQALKVDTAKEELYKAYRQYEWTKKGLSL